MWIRHNAHEICKNILDNSAARMILYRLAMFMVSSNHPCSWFALAILRLLAQARDSSTRACLLRGIQRLFCRFATKPHSEGSNRRLLRESGWKFLTEVGTAHPAQGTTSVMGFGSWHLLGA